MSKYQVYSLEELITYISRGITPKYTEEVNNSAIIINQKCIRDFQINLEPSRRNDLTQRVISEEKKVRLFDILVNSTGVGTLGRVAQFLDDKIKEIISVDTHITIVRPDIKKINPLFLGYLVKSKQSEIESFGIGSTGQTELSRDALKSIRFNVPTDRNRQKEIAEFFLQIDQKIQLNTQINQTLEQIAQALFKSWFVDFDPVQAKVQALSDGMSLEQAELAVMQAISGKTPEELTALSQAQPDRYAELAETAKAFPCEMVEVDGVEVPKGWELSTIGDCYDVVMGQSPKGETYNENKQGMLFYQGRAEFGWRFPTPRLFTTDPKRIAEQNSILMSVRAPVGDINIALEKCCIGRGLAALQHKSKSLSFGLYQIQSIKPELDLFNGEGTVFGSINQANLKNIQIINPDEKFIRLFEKYLSSCDSKIMNNEIENNSLKEIRDLLLPRLLNGEI